MFWGADGLKGMNSFSLKGRPIRILDDIQYLQEKSKEQIRPSIETVGFVDYKAKRNSNSISNVWILHFFNLRVVSHLLPGFLKGLMSETHQQSQNSNESL